MTGDQDDIVARLKRLLPPWFGDDTAPVVDAMIQGGAWVLSQVYALYAFAKLQTRILTATGGWLDMISLDYFGGSFPRRAGQSDASFRAVIIANLLRRRVTRPALEKVLLDVTGRAPIVQEPSRVYDTGAWDDLRTYWDVNGTWGERRPYEGTVIAFRPLPGSLQYGATDTDIYLAVEAVRAEGTKIWVQIRD